MKYRNKLTEEIVIAKTYAEQFICKNNSNYEVFIENKKFNKGKKTSEDKKLNENIENEKSE